jgi:hypothetical protein
MALISVMRMKCTVFGQIEYQWRRWISKSREIHQVSAALAPFLSPSSTDVALD